MFKPIIRVFSVVRKCYVRITTIYYKTNVWQGLKPLPAFIVSCIHKLYSIELLLIENQVKAYQRNKMDIYCGLFLRLVDLITIDFVWLKKITKPLLVLACETNNLNSKISLNKSIVIISSLGKNIRHSTGAPVRWVASPMERQSDTMANIFNEE